MNIVFVNGIPRATADSSPRNYVPNTSFESSTANIAFSGPGISFDRTTTESEVVRGDASLKITTTSSCTTSSYISITLTEFDIVDTQTTMRIGIDYRSLSGYSPAYMQVVLHDGTNEIIPTNTNIPSGQGKIEGYWTTSASQNYTLRLKVTSTGAGQAFNLAIDTIRIYSPGWEEDAANKSNDATLSANSSILYPTQSAVKSYVDTAVSTKQATGNYITALTGDITASGPGSALATLANSGVTAGTYAQVTVDAKGRVTSGSNIIDGGNASST